MKKLASVVVIWGAAALLPSSALARFGMGGPGMGPPPAVAKKALRDAGLSDQQIRRLETLRMESEKQALDIRHEIQKERLELNRLLMADKPDRAAIFKQLERISVLQLQMKKNRIGHLLDVRAEMSVEQWEKVQQLFFEWKLKSKQGRRGGPFGPPEGAGMGPCQGTGPCAGTDTPVR